MRIVAVGMLDSSTIGYDAFFVEVGPDQVMHYHAHESGAITPQEQEPQPVSMVYSSVEKFNHGYLVDPPVPIERLEDLPAYLDRFEITSPTRCRLKSEGT